MCKTLNTCMPFFLLVKKGAMLCCSKNTTPETSVVKPVRFISTGATPPFWVGGGVGWGGRSFPTQSLKDPGWETFYPGVSPLAKAKDQRHCSHARDTLQSWLEFHVLLLLMSHWLESLTGSQITDHSRGGEWSLSCLGRKGARIWRSGKTNFSNLF